MLWHFPARDVIHSLFKPTCDLFIDGHTSRSNLKQPRVHVAQPHGTGIISNSRSSYFSWIIFVTKKHIEIKHHYMTKCKLKQFLLCSGIGQTYTAGAISSAASPPQSCRAEWAFACHDRQVRSQKFRSHGSLFLWLLHKLEARSFSL